MRPSKRLIFVLPIFLATLFLVGGCAQQSAPLQATPPIAKIVPHLTENFDKELIDNYYWLRERDDPEVMAYLEAENAYTDTIMMHTKKLQEKLYNEIVARIKETDLSVPVKRDDYYYYSRTEEGKEYSIYCRKHGSLDSMETVLLNVNQLAEGQEFMSLGAYEVSPDHNLLAYAYDDKGSERYLLKVKNLETGELFPDELNNLSTSVEWGNDNKTLFYTICDDAWRTFKVFRHILGTSQDEDELLYHEEDDQFWIGLSKSKSMKYIFLTTGSQTSSEVYYLDADQPGGKFKIIQPRQKEHEYDVEHHGDYFYIVSNENALNFKVMMAPVASPAKKNWKEFIPHDEKIRINNIEIFKDHLVVYQRENGLKTIRIMNFDNNDDYRVEFPEPVYVYYQESNPDYNSNLLRLSYESMITPPTVYDFDMNSRKWELKKQDEVLGGFNSGDYETRRVFATADDGTEIPISIVYKKGIKQDGNNPFMLNGYGAYGISMEPYFSKARLSLLNRGFIYGKAHIRGGGEMGRQWYFDGKLLNKMNTFTDFINCAEYLIKEKYTSKEKLVIDGGSAGGLLIGVVVNMRPDLFKIVIAGVPFVDLMNTMLDESIPLTVIEYDEWGNPNKKEYFDYMMAYSPYDNVTAQDYPNMLIEAGLNDTRVQYWEPAKWTAKLRAHKTDNNRLLLKTNMGAGHGGQSGRYESIKEIAFEYAFMLDILNTKF
ncbi:MAG: S9 family peptidase [Candidatus Zixiibacteriota bacterium]